MLCVHTLDMNPTVDLTHVGLPHVGLTHFGLTHVGVPLEQVQFTSQYLVMIQSTCKAKQLF